MYKIIIAEDEEDVRNAIVKRINESESGFQVAGAAGDGEEAIRMVSELKPDILVTDICMPKVNGLELIRRIREISRDMPVVVISGYDEFAYAKEAVSLGVKEYLLKPFLPKELFEVFEKIRRQLEEKSLLEKNIERMSARIEQNKEYSKEHLMDLILEGAAEARILGEEMGLITEQAWYCVAFVRYENPPDQLNQKPDMDTLEQYLRIIMENYFCGDMHILDVYYRKEQYILIFRRTGGSVKKFLEDVLFGMKKISMSMEQYHHIQMKCAVGKAYGDFEKIGDSYREALNIWRSNLYQEQRVISCYDEEKSRENVDDEYVEKLSDQLILSIEMGQTREAMEKLSEMIDYYAGFSIRQIEYIGISLVKLVLRISDSVAKGGGTAQVWNDQQIITYLKRHFAYGSLMEAKKFLGEYIEKCCAQLAEANETLSDRIAANAKAIIDHNLGNEAFSLEMLASELHFSSNYVRQLFKSKTGINFSDYLFQKRMEAAEALLRNPKYKIQEIAEMTGYSNQRYFARCFKKYYGITPTSYRDQEGKPAKQGEPSK